MARNLNKKVLCFIDEYGTAGSGPLFFGAVLVMARDAGRIDKCFSDLLRANANEIHAVNLDDRYLQGLLQEFWAAVPRNQLVLLNHEIPRRGGSAPVVYANGIVETVKIGIKRFRQDVLGRDSIGNIDVITDVNHHNDHPEFDAEIERARREDGRFRGVNRISRLDSSASRLLQLSDIVAHARKWIMREELGADGLRSRYGIQTP